MPQPVKPRGKWQKAVGAAEHLFGRLLHPVAGVNLRRLASLEKPLDRCKEIHPLDSVGPWSDNCAAVHEKHPVGLILLSPHKPPIARRKVGLRPRAKATVRHFDPDALCPGRVEKKLTEEGVEILPVRLSKLRKARLGERGALG